jgi:hypothetical protein
LLSRSAAAKYSTFVESGNVEIRSVMIALLGGEKEKKVNSKESNTMQADL